MIDERAFEVAFEAFKQSINADWPDHPLIGDGTQPAIRKDLRAAIEAYLSALEHTASERGQSGTARRADQDSGA